MSPGDQAMIRSLGHVASASVSEKLETPLVTGDGLPTPRELWEHGSSWCGKLELL